MTSSIAATTQSVVDESWLFLIVRAVFGKEMLRENDVEEG